MKELRCGFCNKLLAKLDVKTGCVEIKCKCGALNTWVNGELKPLKKG
jgi:phage FluMu protein Com